MGVITELSLQSLPSAPLLEEQVNRIVIKCPITGKLVYTGFAMDPETFNASPVEEMDPIECPACHQMHRWTKKDALFEREDPKERAR
jgi:hypothetical protein